MDRFTALSRGTQLMLAAGVLLLIDTFLAWQDFGNQFTEAVGVEASANAWHGFWGVVLGLLTLALLAWIVIRMADVALPIELPERELALGLGVAILVFALLKNLIDDESTVWSYVGVVLAALVAVGAYLRWQEPEAVSAPAAAAPEVAPEPAAPEAPSPPEEPEEPAAPGTEGPPAPEAPETPPERPGAPPETT